MWKQVAVEGSNCPQGFLGCHDLSTSARVMAMLGQVESWSGRDPPHATASVKGQMRRRFCFTRAQTRILVYLCLGPWKMKNLFQIFVTTGLFPCRVGNWIHTICIYQKALRLINEKLVQGSPLLKAPLADGRSKCKLYLWRNISQSPGIPTDNGLRNRRVWRREKVKHRSKQTSRER